MKMTVTEMTMTVVYMPVPARAHTATVTAALMMPTVLAKATVGMTVTTVSPNKEEAMHGTMTRLIRKASTSKGVQPQHLMPSFRASSSSISSRYAHALHALYPALSARIELHASRLVSCVSRLALPAPSPLRALPSLRLALSAPPPLGVSRW